MNVADTAQLTLAGHCVYGLGTTIDVSGLLRHSGLTTYDGATVSGSGGAQIFHDGNVSITEDTLFDIPQGLVHWAPGTHTTIHSGNTLAVNALLIGDGDNANQFRAVATVQNGTMEINTITPWHLFGVIILESAFMGGSER